MTLVQTVSYHGSESGVWIQACTLCNLPCHTSYRDDVRVHRDCWEKEKADSGE